MKLRFPSSPGEHPISGGLKGELRSTAASKRHEPCDVYMIDRQFFELRSQSTQEFVGWAKCNIGLTGPEDNFIRFTDRNEMVRYINDLRRNAYKASSSHIRNASFTLRDPSGKYVGKVQGEVVGELRLLKQKIVENELEPQSTPPPAIGTLLLIR